MYYKYIRLQKKPDRCPICHRDFVREEKYVKEYLVDLPYNSQIFDLNEWRCLYCGQPIFKQSLDIDDKDIFFLYLLIFPGWSGQHYALCISFNNRTLDTTCILYHNGEYKQIPLPDDLKETIMSNQLSLLTYPNVRRSGIYDNSSYWFSCHLGNESHDTELDDHTLQFHPLFKKIISIVDTM